MASYNNRPVDLTEAFNGCVDLLHAGYSMQDCLRTYPQYAESLRPLLHAAEAVRRANPPVPADARERIRARVIASAAVAARRRASPWQGRGMLAAAALLIVIFAAVLIAMLSRNTEPEPLREVPIESPSATAEASLTPTLSPTQTATATETSTPTLTPTSRPTQTPVLTEAAPDCIFTIVPSSANLRSGPGTGYSSVGYGYAGEQYPVIAAHSSGLWYQVQYPEREVWAAATVGELSGECAALPVVDTPIQAASTPDADGGTGSDDGGEDPGDSGSGDDSGGDNESGDEGDNDNSGGDDNVDNDSGEEDSNDNGEDPPEIED